MDGTNAKIVDKICEYSEKVEVKDMLQEYMRRLVAFEPKFIASN
jgi:hypothetical protein